MLNNHVQEPNKQVRKPTKRSTSIGGQAVLEGVMMRGCRSMAVSVRDSKGMIHTDSSRIVPTKEKNIFFRMPIVRGVVNFVATMFMGISTLMKSAEVAYADIELTEQEKKKQQQKQQRQAASGKQAKQNSMGFAMVISLILGLTLSIGLFFVLPTLVTQQLFMGVFGWKFDSIVTNLIEGGVRFFIFIAYILLVSCMKDIRRTFMYHGAEHRVINCYESNQPLTVANVQTCKTFHNRCGTTFIFFVLFLSILVYALFDGILSYYQIYISENLFFKIATKLALLPLVAGLSYELLKALSKTNFFLLYPLKWPGMLLQKITTKPPTDDMVEVALMAFQTVQRLDENLLAPTEKFVLTMPIQDYCQQMNEYLLHNGISKTDFEWVMSDVFGCKRSQIAAQLQVSPDQQQRIQGLLDRLQKGEPLQHVLGYTMFLDCKVSTDRRALIPRFETELLCETAIHQSAQAESALDLCCGSGAIAIALKKSCKHLHVTASDISEEALELAKENAQQNDVEIAFVQGDMFAPLLGKVFDMIICNPPYIPSAQLDRLDVQVKDYDPMIALNGGVDGLDFYRILKEQAMGYLSSGGILLMEVGFDQADIVADMFHCAYDTKVMTDLDGVKRMVQVQKRENE